MDRLNAAGVSAKLDVYHTNMHAFDMMRPDSELGKKAADTFNKHFEYAKDNYFAEN